MSLRLLLADESPSIKKAFSLALKDYGVQIQTVHQGTDVAELYEKFNPDICFMDILLPKLNGYDACGVLKKNENSKETPVVLMWSGFMELDLEKSQACFADSSIEKPFETETLRALIKSLVPKVGQNAITDHLVLDDIPEIKLDDAGTEAKNTSEFDSLEDTPSIELQSLDNANAGAELSELPSIDNLKFDHLAVSNNSNEEEDNSFPDLPDLDSLLNDDDDLSDFAMPEGLNLKPLSKDALDEIADGDDEEWMSEELKKIDSERRYPAPEGMDDVDAFSMEKLDSNEVKPAQNNFAMPEGLDLPPTPDKISVLKDAAEEAAIESMRDEASEEVEIAKPTPAPQPPVEALKEESNGAVQPLKEDHESELLATQAIPQMSKEELKRLILAQSKDIIESVVWDVVPELAKEMIQKEIQRLTGEIKHEGELR